MPQYPNVGPLGPVPDMSEEALQRAAAAADPSGAYFGDADQDRGPSPFDDPSKGSPYVPAAADATTGVEDQSPDKKTGGWVDPTTSDPNVQKYQARINEIDDQLKQRRSGIGGIIQGFSPNGDKVAQGLLAERQAIQGSLNSAEKQAMQYGKGRFQRVGTAMVDMATGYPVYQDTTRQQVAQISGDSRVSAAQVSADARTLGVQLTGDYRTDIANINAAAHVQGINLQQAGATTRNDATNQSREGMNEATNASREGIAGQGNETKTNIANAGLQQKSAQATATDLLAHAKMLAAIGDTDGAKQYSQIAGQMLQKQIGAPAPQAPPPGAPPAGAMPPGAAQAAKGVPDGTTGGGGKYVAKGGYWYPAPAPDPNAPMAPSH